MSITQYLAVIDRLRSRLSGGARPVGRRAAGPGFHIAELRTSDDFWEDDGTRREETLEQYEADRDALSQRCSAHAGAPRTCSACGAPSTGPTEGEDSTPSRWATLSCHVPDLHLWRADRRWIALGVSQ